MSSFLCLSKKVPFDAFEPLADDFVAFFKLPSVRDDVAAFGHDSRSIDRLVDVV